MEFAVPAYQIDDRVVLIRTTDQHTQLTPGTRGTVTFVDDHGTVHTRWDDGSRLGMSARDGYEPITPMRDLGRLLDTLEADYSPGTPTRAVVDALTAVVRLWHLHRRERHDGVPLAQLDRALSDPLRPLLAAWLHDGNDLHLS